MIAFVQNPYVFFMAGMLCLGLGLALSAPDDFMMPKDDEPREPSPWR